MVAGVTLTFAQIEQLWKDNGGPAGWAPLMAGIAEAESGGNTVALNNNPSTGDYSVGLWQINYYNGLLASRTNKYGSPAALQADPNAQAKAAIDLFGGGPGITNWQGDATYKAWTAAGSPSQPSDATVQKWTGGKGGSGISSATTATGGAAGGPKGVGGSDLSQCVISFPGFLFFSGPCILTKGGVKWLSGGLAMFAGLGLTTFGVVVLAAAGFQASGAKQAVGKVAQFVPGVGGAIGKAASAAGSSGGPSSSSATRTRSPRSVGLGPSPTSARPSVAGRRESRDIERQFAEVQRQVGPIGPRGGSATSTRVAREQRRGTSVPGAGRPRTPEQRARARTRAGQPF
jgi:hypothetical protein